MHEPLTEQNVAICAGKQSVVDYLVENHGFTLLTLKQSNTATPVTSDSSDLIDALAATSISTSSSPVAVNAKHLEFDDITTLDDYVSQSWQTHYVLPTILNETILDALQKRPYFIFVSIDAPLLTRYDRYVSRCATTNLPPPSLESFVEQHDSQFYSSTTSSPSISNLAALSARSQLRILNSAPSGGLAQLHKRLDALNLLDPARLRPTWDQYFMQLANLAARRSNCMKRQVGCVIVREKRVISTGYNGTPRNVTNCMDGGCARCNTSAGRNGQGLSTCLCLHAEENALLEAGRERIGDGAVLYCNTWVFFPFSSLLL